MVRDVFGLADNAVLGIALFHTEFNILGVILFFPLIPILACFLSRLFAGRQTILTRYIPNTTP